MTRYAHADVLDQGPKYIEDNCDKVVLTDVYSNVYATVTGSAKVAEASLVSGDFSRAGADGAARVLTAAISGKSGGNAVKAVADGTNMHIAFLQTGALKVLYVTEESSNQAITSGNPVTFNSTATYTAGQPTA